MNYSRWHMLLITVLSFSLFATSTASAATTTNAKKYKWAKPAVEFMASHGVMQSYEQEADRLNQTVSKAELTQMIHTLFKEFRVEPDKKIEIPGVPEGSTYYSIFRDVYGSIPSNPSGMIAAADQINYHNYTFTYLPTKELSRWDLLIAMSTLFPETGNHLDEVNDKKALAHMKSFKDIPIKSFSSSEEYEKWDFAHQLLAAQFGLIQPKKQNPYIGSELDYVKIRALLNFAEAGIMKPDAKGKFYPNQKVTLAETVVILQRIYNFYGGKGYKHQPTKDELIPRELNREYVYRNSAHGSLISDNVALVSTDNISTAYLAISATEPVDLKVIVNGESITYSYEQLSVLDAPIMIAFDGADYAEVYPILRRTGKPIVDQGEIEGNEFFEKLDLFFYFSGKWTDFSVFNTLWEDESYEEFEQ
ncbi:MULTISPECIES: S-layer homology domain-containing protein [Paenibacillus]|uniref:S-layer homology domain-containing protein n=1 Tax=Paenibacillus TaxID=44249 RepID=UPI00164997CC|nr:MULTISPECIES: S-layer homology domain-containing protein [Paenibacillus]